MILETELPLATGESAGEAARDVCEFTDESITGCSRPSETGLSSDGGVITCSDRFPDRLFVLLRMFKQSWYSDSFKDPRRKRRLKNRKLK